MVHINTKIYHHIKCLVKLLNKKVIYSPQQVEINDIFQLRMARGEFAAKVLNKGDKNAKKKDI